MPVPNDSRCRCPFEAVPTDAIQNFRFPEYVTIVVPVQEIIFAGGPENNGGDDEQHKADGRGSLPMACCRLDCGRFRHDEGRGFSEFGDLMNFVPLLRSLQRSSALFPSVAKSNFWPKTVEQWHKTRSQSTTFAGLRERRGHYKPAKDLPSLVGR